MQRQASLSAHVLIYSILNPSRSPHFAPIAPCLPAPATPQPHYNDNLNLCQGVIYTYFTTIFTYGYISVTYIYIYLYLACEALAALCNLMWLSQDATEVYVLHR